MHSSNIVIAVKRVSPHQKLSIEERKKPQSHLFRGLLNTSTIVWFARFSKATSLKPH